MQVKVKVIGNMYKVFKMFKNIGSEFWCDEKQAKLYEDAGVAKIIETPAPAFKPKISKR